ncbi:hypothetical protein GQX74_009792 [Glossina fuscipes]|nr:hypothetical protein GQX74_009792 [Glossina fuscipes]
MYFTTVLLGVANEMATIVHPYHHRSFERLPHRWMPENQFRPLLYKHDVDDTDEDNDVIVMFWLLCSTLLFKIIGLISGNPSGARNCCIDYMMMIADSKIPVQ